MSAEQGRHEGEIRILQAELEEERAENIRMRRQMADREQKMSQVIAEVNQEKQEARGDAESTAREVCAPTYGSASVPEQIPCFDLT